MLILQIFKSFFLIGAFAFGGGYAMIPLLRDEIVFNRTWLDGNIFTDMIAISEMTPGPIAINMATYTGFQMSGILGSAVATLAVTLPSFIIMSIAYKAFSKLEGTDYREWFFYGIRPIVVGLILSGVLTTIPGSIVDPIGLVLAIIFFLTLYKKDVHPIKLIIAAGVIGVIFYGFR